MSVHGDEVRTESLGVAAYLFLHGHEPERLEMLNPRAAVFVFSGDGAVSGLVEDYEDGCAEVEPRDFQKCLTRARRDLFAFLDGQ